MGFRSGSKTFLEPANVDYQFLFWKYSPIFLFLIQPNVGPFCTFWAPLGYFFGPLGLFLGSRSGSKTFLEPTNIDCQYLFGRYSRIFLFLFGQILGLFALFGLFGAIFGVGVRFKNFFGTCLHRLTTFILEV